MMPTIRATIPKKVVAFIQPWAKSQEAATKNFEELAVRGANLRKTIKASAPAKRAVAQTSQAKRQVKAATTSIRKAVTADVEATKSAAKKVG